MATWTVVLAAPISSGCCGSREVQRCGPVPRHPSTSTLTPSFCTAQSKYPALRMSQGLAGWCSSCSYTAAWRLFVSQPEYVGIPCARLFLKWRDNPRPVRHSVRHYEEGILEATKYLLFWNWEGCWVAAREIWKVLARFENEFIHDK